MPKLGARERRNRNAHPQKGLTGHVSMAKPATTPNRAKLKPIWARSHVSSFYCTGANMQDLQPDKAYRQLQQTKQQQKGIRSTPARPNPAATPNRQRNNLYPYWPNEPQ
ncbi:hypothetical protein Nepgr_033605 [Nepenthes gracilis]|uniref:Uncharacterized protein n=1 Tax=Nepenthes gracilis TaxID=150966 RepID=A0AAD3TMA0_NEPGR|nr:hypothetical protein Nepgr_033605 [Nepenthes gracilis]